MKLNYQRTVYIGIIFLIISMFWQTYDMLIARTLIDKFGLNQTWSGLVMALDNIMAVFLLPLFGTLSDKSNRKIGRRTPFIITGTIIAALSFMFLSVADMMQTNKIKESDIISKHYDIAFANDADTRLREHWQLVIDNMADERFESLVRGNISQRQFDEWLAKIGDPMQRIVNNADETLTTREFAIIKDLFYNYLSQRAFELTANDLLAFIIFISLLFVAIIAMATFRSPAVALMPDITVKPLRSKANAIINLMGAIGGIIAINIIMFSGLKKSNYEAHLAIFIIVGLLMLILLGVYLIKVREVPWVLEKEKEDILYGIKKKEDDNNDSKLSKDKLFSMTFLLVTIFLLFMGYNAVMSKIADYLPKVLNMDFYEFPFIVSQIVVIALIYPLGLLSMRLGRKASVLIGISVLALSLFTVMFLEEGMVWRAALLIMTAGVGWSLVGINLYPMVVEVSKGHKVGRFTGYYYSASMLAQIVTPILSGIFMDNSKFGRLVLFPYATIFIVMGFFTMLIVRHGDSQRVKFFKHRKKNI